MKITVLFLLLSVVLLSCENDIDTSKTAKIKKTQIESLSKKDSTSNLIVETAIAPEDGEIIIENNIYTEYYPGDKNKIKFQGEQNKNGDRNGKWLYFSEDGLELSVTNYSNGMRNGMSLVKYPNGNLHYTGEYLNDKTVGVWKTYSVEGVKTNEKDYGYPK